jgi:hypothetical protein
VESVCVAKPEERETTIQSTGERVGVRQRRAGGREEREGRRRFRVREHCRREEDEEGNV